MEAFVRGYYGQVDAEDLAERDLADLYGAALSHLHFARKREPGRAKVRVFNPTIEEHGWQSTHTVIEIVNDDMPFLVDSVTMEVNRHGLTLHLIVHPIFAVAARRGRDARRRRRRRATDAIRESFIHVEVDRVTEAARACSRSRTDVERVLDDVRARGRPTGRRCANALRDIVRRDRREPAAAARRRSSPKAETFLAGSPTTTSRSSATAATISSSSTARTR